MLRPFRTHWKNNNGIRPGNSWLRRACLASPVTDLLPSRHISLFPFLFHHLKADDHFGKSEYSRVDRLAHSLN